MTQIPKRLSDLRKAIALVLFSSALFVAIGLAVQPATTDSVFLANAVGGEMVAEYQRQTPAKPGDLEQQLGWTAWSG